MVYHACQLPSAESFIVYLSMQAGLLLVGAEYQLGKELILQIWIISIRSETMKTPDRKLFELVSMYMKLPLLEGIELALLFTIGRLAFVAPLKILFFPAIFLNIT